MRSRRWQRSWPRFRTLLLHGTRGRPRQGGARNAVHGPVLAEAPPSSSEAVDAQYFSVAAGPAAERSAPGARTNAFTVRVPAWQMGGWSVGILAYQCAWFTCLGRR